MIKTRLKLSTSHNSLPRELSRSALPGLMILLACLYCPTTGLSAVDPHRYRGGLRNSPGPKKLNQKQIDAVVKSLRDKTGFRRLHFDADGFLNLGERADFTGGSASARALIVGAVESDKSIDLESDDGSSSVAFARLSTATIYMSRMTGERIEVYPIGLDFTDFKKLRGDKKVIEAFDLGFALLHELGHAVLGLRDNTEDMEGPGECEEYINRIRRELNLPERQNYVARAHKTGLVASRGQVEHAELVFTHSGVKPRKYSLIWEALQVGPIKRIPSLSTKPVSVSVGGQ